MKKLLVVLALMSVTGSVCAQTVQINGAGATFPYPIYSKWFDEYAKVDPSARFNYQSIGSGGGQKQIVAQTVDFGASDGPMSDENLKAAPGKIDRLAEASQIVQNLHTEHRSVPMRSVRTTFVSQQENLWLRLGAGACAHSSPL